MRAGSTDVFESLPDIPRLFTALAEWGAGLVYMLATARASSPHDLAPSRSMPRWRIAVQAAGGMGAFLVTQECLGQSPLSLWIPGMGLAFLLLWGLIAAGT